MKAIIKFFLYAFFTLVSLIFFSCQYEDITAPVTNGINENFITLEKAIDIGEKLNFTDKINNTTSIIEKKISQIIPISDNENETGFYVINYEKGGFTLLAADKRSIPILSYAEEGYFNTNKKKQPEGLIFWQNSILSEIEYLRDNNISQTVDVKYQWDHLNLMDIAGKEPPNNGCENEFEEISPLISTFWHQSCGYNTYMPVLGCTPSMPCGGHALAGCVPIAIAQVMKYHQYPTGYNWSNMPINNGTNTTALFIKDIHDAIGTNISYYCNSTGVNSSYDVGLLFRNSFSYSTATQAAYDQSTVKIDLRANRPVILSGGTHMWVCDGFKNSKICIFDDNGNPIGASWYLTLHMNWGWGGDYNGWYFYNNFNPNGHNYNNNVQMVTNIKP